tara:strand:+ start:416 stop:520 length:105 start_codon:yes stop_codon:yes gene_type:complete
MKVQSSGSSLPGTAAKLTAHAWHVCTLVAPTVVE